METGYAVAQPAEYESRQKSKPKKKGNFISRWLLKSLKGAVEAERQDQEMNQIKVPRGLQIGSGPSIDSDKGIRFQVYKAAGGFVVETATYDRTRDRHINGLHIINDNEKFGDKIEKIITLEALKQ